MEKRVCFGLWFQRERNNSGSVLVSGNLSRKVSDNISIHTQKGSHLCETTTDSPGTVCILMLVPLSQEGLQRLLRNKDFKEPIIGQVGGTVGEGLHFGTGGELGRQMKEVEAALPPSPLPVADPLGSATRGFNLEWLTN